MAGILYGIGVGPGDPELMTLKAVRIIGECDVIAVPGEAYQDSVAYRIAVGAVPDLINKQIISISMPMTKDQQVLAASHRRAVEQMKSWLDGGKKIAFLTLGDPTIYSTYIYIHQQILALGYATEIVSGIPSFCAVAARLNMGLVEGAEQLHVIPASYQIEAALHQPGTKVLMKAGRQLSKVKKQIQKMDLDAVMIENCGMEQEKIFTSLAEIDEQAGYYSLMIIKDKKKAEK